MSDEQNESTVHGDARPGTDDPTGWHIYDGRDVIVQLFEPYIAGVDEKEGSPIGTNVLQGTFRITKGSGGNEALLFLLYTRQDSIDTFITLHPSDVKHLTYMEKREPSRVVRP